MKGGNIETYVSQICGFRKWTYSKDSGGYMTVGVNVQDGGTHNVTIMRRLDMNGTISVLFFCDLGPADKAVNAAEVLRDNGYMNHGAFAIWGDRFIVMDTQLEEAADIEEVAAAMFHLANYADRLEKKKLAATVPTNIGTILGGPKPDGKPL